MADVTIKFQNQNQAKCFMDWLDGQGEQGYFEVADILEGEKGQEFVDKFSYDWKSNTVVGEKL
jgi:hypothetical protein